jgi:hypothetical protein
MYVLTECLSGSFGRLGLYIYISSVFHCLNDLFSPLNGMPSLGVKKGYRTLEQLVQTNQENWQTPHVKMTPQKKSGDVLTEQGN